MRESSAGAALRTSAERLIARALMALPPRVQVRLSGRPPVQLDGLTLSPDTQLALAMLERRGGPELQTLTPEQARLERRYAAAVYGGPPYPVGEVRDLLIEGEQPLRARHYATPREEPGTPPLLVFFHGGGFVFGDLDTHDGLCRLLCRHAGVHVLAVDYRLAPEDPYPAAVDDAIAALRWAFEHAERLGADPGRVAVGGDSAGGNLAAVATLIAAREGPAVPALQLLIYPATDLVGRRPSRDLFAEGFFLTSVEMDWFKEQYVPAGTDETDARVSPLLADDLSGLAPAIVATAGFDPLRDEGEDYARALSAAGNRVILRRFPGLIHGFASATGVSRSSRHAVVELAGCARAMLAAGALLQEPAAVAAPPAEAVAAAPPC
jgi:acetyl esterase